MSVNVKRKPPTLKISIFPELHIPVINNLLNRCFMLNIPKSKGKGKDSPVYEVKPETAPGGTRILHRNLLQPRNHLPVDVGSKVPHRQKCRKEIRRETNHAPTTLVEESSDDESEQYELNCEPERQPGPQNDHSEESVSEDIAWESATVSDKGEREDGCSADEEQEHHPPVEETSPLAEESENEAGPSIPGNTSQEGASLSRVYISA